MEALRPFAAAAVAASLALAAPEAASAETNLLFILDGSNSMWGQVEGQPKIKSAQKVLTDLLSDLPQDTNVGLMVYGHTSKDSCDDIEIVSSLGADTRQAVAAQLTCIPPTGRTPLAGPRCASATAMPGRRGLSGCNLHTRWERRLEWHLTSGGRKCDAMHARCSYCSRG